MLNRLFILTYGIITAMTVVAYTSPDIPPSEFWISAFLPYTIPGLVILHLIVAVYFLIAKKWLQSLIPLFFIAFGLSFLPRIVSFHFSQQQKAGATFSVLSYNARVFNVYEIYNKNDPSISANIIKDAINMEGDVKCFQEFYSEKNSEKFNTIKRLSKTHPYYYFEPFFVNHVGGGFGMAIFSKYPIDKKENIQFKEKSNNQILYVDIVIGRNKVRVFNVHLQSMSINDDELADSPSNHFKQNLLKALLRYKQGAIRRSKQVDRLISEINRSPYPVMVCGDFNEPPLGYAYKQVSNLLLNSQEEAGHGIGATHNGRIPFLRIDNQFYQDGIDIHSFDVLNNKKLSDHYPLLGYYSFK
ncbi:MAG: endonuclease/exonuclease/phosphatase family protein [Chitinophagaceae bacterium]|nr:endonuclease/exonuclease/phosphatase family protein [Chitinophagaceae bacterium]